MYKTLLLAALVAVTLAQDFESKENFDGEKSGKPQKGGFDGEKSGKRQKGDRKQQREGKKGMLEKNEDGKTCKPCKEGYEQGEDCRCNVSESVAAMCRPDWELNVDECSCTAEGEEPADAKCFYGYRVTGDDCMCERPPQDCEIECERGQKKNPWECECEDMPICEPCGKKGQKQHPWTCECRDYTSMPLKCRWGMELVATEDQCMCQKETDDGMKERKARCRKGYEVSADCSTCDLMEEYTCKRRRCTKGQAWSDDECMCVAHDECGFEKEECDEGMYYDKLECECLDKPVKEKKT